MSEIALQGVAGSVDNIPPVYDPNRGFRLWALFEIFDGLIGENRFVPNVKDRVLDTDTETMYRVTAINPTTYVPTLVKATATVYDGVLPEEDVLLGVGPGPQNNTYRAYLNTKVMPFHMEVDHRCFVWGSRAKYMRLFRGSVLNSSSKVISAVYDSAGNYLGQDVPLELAQIEGNKTRMNVTSFKCTEKVPDGEVVYAVFYSSGNEVLSKQQLLVENTDVIARPNSGVKYVTDIYLDTPFLSDADSALIQYPINVLMQGLNLMGVVKYSDGETRRLPIDGTKFELFGLEDYLLTVVGEEIPVLLNYNLSPEEIAIGLTVGENRNVPKHYRAQSLTANGSYSVKLFAYPVWLGPQDGYRLEWFLANLERTNIWRATPYVRMNEGGPTFSPRAYGTNQRLVVSVDLQAVNASFNKYKHVETIDVTLLRPGTEHETNWQIGFEPSQNPPYGVQNYASSTFVDTNNWKIKVDMGAATLDDWLARLYFRTIPLYDPQKEAAPPLPTHFAFVFTNRSIEFPIAEWKMQHTISEAVPNGGTLFVRFFKRTPDNDIQLSIAGVPIYQT